MTVYDASVPHKIVLLWGPLFVGAPVRPNTLNMPKSAVLQSVMPRKSKPTWAPYYHCVVRTMHYRLQNFLTDEQVKQ